MMNDWMLTRAARLLEGVDMAREAGLEIGPLASPLLHKAPGRIVHYADYADRDTLIRESANNPTIDPALIPEIDHVIAPLPKSLDRTYDFIVAAHVAEHVPDLLGWITTLMGWLTPPHGRLILAIPDKRYCFDIQRPLSTVGQVLDAYYQRRERPTLGAVYDGFSMATSLDTARSWTEDPYRGALTPLFTELQAFSLARTADQTGLYRDCHCWVMTYMSFLAIIEAVRSLGIEGVHVVRSAAPVEGSNEFHVVLRPDWSETPYPASRNAA